VAVGSVVVGELVVGEGADGGVTLGGETDGKVAVGVSTNFLLSIRAERGGSIRRRLLLKSMDQSVSFLLMTEHSKPEGSLSHLTAYYRVVLLTD
jgi:hypothetical protein